MTEYRGDGLRAQRIQDQRERELEDLEIRKKKLTDNLEMKDIANKFSATYDSVAGEISAATVSLLLHCAGRHIAQALCGVQSGSDEMMKLRELVYLDFH